MHTNESQIIEDGKKALLEAEKKLQESHNGLRDARSRSTLDDDWHCITSALQVVYAAMDAVQETHTKLSAAKGREEKGTQDS